MKKFSKFVFATLSVAAFVGGAYYFVKNILNKDSADDFEDFEDDFDDFDDEEDSETSKEDRGYVTLDFQEPEAANIEKTEEAINTAAVEETLEASEEEKVENPSESE